MHYCTTYHLYNILCVQNHKSCVCPSPFSPLYPSPPPLTHPPHEHAHTFVRVHGPSDATSGNLPKETRNTNSKEYMHPYVHGTVIYNRQDLEAAQVLMSNE